MSTLLTLASSASDVLLALPNPDPIQPPGTEGFTTIMGWVKWAALILCVIAIIVAAAMMAINQRRGEGGEHAGKIGIVLVAVILITASTSLVGFIMGA